MYPVDCVIIGAGVIGLGVARSLAAKGKEVVVLESANTFGSGISSRNSEVIHGGIYYPQGSLKAELCVEGRQRLYRYCQERSIRHKRCGKLIVATSLDQLEQLRRLEIAAKRNGVGSEGDEAAQLKWMTGREVLALEPQVYCAGALHSPDTGIVDSHELMIHLKGDAEESGAVFAFGQEVVGGQGVAGGIELEIRDVNERSNSNLTLIAGTVVNAAAP